MDVAAASIAAAIGEPSRARMLYCLMDNRARTSTELAVEAGVSPSTASAHLNRLKEERLIAVAVQGKHHYYRLGSPGVAKVLETLSVLACGPQARFVPNTPMHLRAARTCYDHIAGALGVSLHDRLRTAGWLSNNYALTRSGTNALTTLGIDVEDVLAQRRRFAYACLDWSERRSHLGGALGAALLKYSLRKKWLTQDLDDRTLQVTSLGKRDLLRHFGVQWQHPDLLGHDRKGVVSHKR